MGYSSLALWDYPAGMSDIKSVTSAVLYESFIFEAHELDTLVAGFIKKCSLA